MFNKKSNIPNTEDKQSISLNNKIKIIPIMIMALREFNNLKFKILQTFCLPILCMFLIGIFLPKAHLIMSKFIPITSLGLFDSIVILIVTLYFSVIMSVNLFSLYLNRDKEVSFFAKENFMWNISHLNFMKKSLVIGLKMIVMAMIAAIAVKGFGLDVKNSFLKAFIIFSIFLFLVKDCLILCAISINIGTENNHDDNLSKFVHNNYVSLYIIFFAIPCVNFVLSNLYLSLNIYAIIIGQIISLLVFIYQMCITAESYNFFRKQLSNNL